MFAGVRNSGCRTRSRTARTTAYARTQNKTGGPRMRAGMSRTDAASAKMKLNMKRSNQAAIATAPTRTMSLLECDISGSGRRMGKSPGDQVVMDVRRPRFLERGSGMEENEHDVK